VVINNADAGRYLPIGVESDQFAAAKHPLRLFGGAGDESAKAPAAFSSGDATSRSA
jgi:hypothetical protein